MHNRVSQSPASILIFSYCPFSPDRRPAQWQMMCVTPLFLLQDMNGHGGASGGEDGFLVSLSMMCSMLKFLLLSMCAFSLQPSPTAHLSLCCLFPFFHVLSLSVIPGERNQKKWKEKKTMTIGRTDRPFFCNEHFSLCMLFLLFQPSQHKERVLSLDYSCPFHTRPTRELL